jgi:hypothetical protein
MGHNWMDSPLHSPHHEHVPVLVVVRVPGAPAAL